MHLQDGNFYDYLAPNLTENVNTTKFHFEVMKCINVCTDNNRFGILQGRKLITLNNLFKTLKKETLNKYFKKTYLKFLYQVYMTEIPGSVYPTIELNSLEDLFREVIIKDIDLAFSTLETLISISSKGFYSNIVCKKVVEFKIATFMQIISSSNPVEFADY